MAWLCEQSYHRNNSFLGCIYVAAPYHRYNKSLMRAVKIYKDCWQIQHSVNGYVYRKKFSGVTKRQAESKFAEHLKNLAIPALFKGQTKIGNFSH